ncbi:MAG: hypothetical protein ABIO06_03580 [Pseudolysinimonas sp.]
MSTTVDRLLGSWRVTMHHSEVAEPVHGMQRYERILDGAFVSLDWTFEHPDFPNAFAVLDETHFNYFDVRGVVRIFDFQVDDGGWRMTWIDPGFSQRSTARFLDDDTIDVDGERSSDEGTTWQHDFRMELHRV